MLQEKLTKIREKQATMPGWSQESRHQGSLDRNQESRPRSQQSGARSGSGDNTFVYTEVKD